MRWLWNWVLCTFFGYVRISDYVDVKITFTKCTVPVPAVPNMELLIGKDSKAQDDSALGGGE